ncbi:SDR family NAD(P)-dependent oxidoreductase [Winogradskya humida]|uniref:Ketoreductase domain-containing protein n=1 Tax=Winogradskya humida TaxID=113566 RepID=A0ABQ4A5A2_9ACTN|nr:SDR family NAD(P)-dependent oxidoreductase [Actinoplanes humidus]GIE26027.1 hypothetical protein Ahu01nite_091290 [Actinoplanes humidus]
MPSAVSRLVAALNAYDTDAVLAVFAPDAVVTDDGKTYRGHDEIRRWNTLEVAAARVVLTPLATTEEDGRTVVTMRATGDFPGSPLSFAFHLRPADPDFTRIAELSIALNPGRTWFITGGTPGGFGVAFADAALDRGDRVALTTRKPDQLADWAAPHGDRVLLLPADVTDAAQVSAAVAKTEATFGGIDVLVNNAGRGWVGTVEGMPDQAVRDLFELNFFAVLTVLRAALPGMRARRTGTVVNVSSVAGLAGAQAFGHYAAAKYAIEGITGSLRREVEPFGITVIAVEPGAFRTNAYAGFAGEPVNEGIADYEPLLTAVHTTMVEQDGHQPGDPAKAARAVIDAVYAAQPPRNLVLGSAGFDRVTTHLDELVTGIRAGEQIARSVDFPTG